MPEMVQIRLEAFRRGLRYIASAYEIVPLEVIVAAVENGDALDARWVALTFDDGYANNLSVARPILAEFGDLPATVFVTTGPVDRGRLFWWLRVALAIHHTEAATIDVPSINLRARLGSRSARARVAAVAIDRLKALPQPTLDEAVEALTASVDAERMAQLESRASSARPMTWEEVRRLAEEPNISIGAHTVNHVIVNGRQSQDVIERELTDCKRALEREVGPVTAFSFPNGQAGDFCDQAKDTLRAAGYRCAVSAIPGEVTTGADVFELPRLGAVPAIPALARRLATAARGDLNGAMW